MCHFSQGECWCKDEPITDCTCNKAGGCPQGQYKKHAVSCVDMKKDMRIPTSQQMKKLQRHLDTN